MQRGEAEPLNCEMTSIEDIAFYNCSSLTSITIPEVGRISGDMCSTDVEV